MKKLIFLLLAPLLLCISCGLEKGDKVVTKYKCYGAVTVQVLHIHVKKQYTNPGLTEAQESAGALKSIPKGTKGKIVQKRKGLGGDRDYFEVSFEDGYGYLWVTADDIEKQ